MLFLVFLLAFVLPVSFTFWFVNFLSSDVPEGGIPSPFRWLFSLLFPLFIAAYGLKKKSLQMSGAITGVLLGFLMTISNLCFLASILVFFITSSKATKFRAERKKVFEADFKEGGQRNWVQVICNGGVAGQMSILYMIQWGLGECLVDFQNEYPTSWLAISVMAALACANGDTWASELGTVLTDQQPRLITTLQKVPKGTNGGVTVVGLLVSALGGGVVGLAFYVCQLLCLSQPQLLHSAPQWPVVLMGVFAGLFGSLVDSLLGAVLQFSGMDMRSKKIVDRPGPKVQRISGLALLDNHSVNLIASLISALFVPFVAAHIQGVFTA